MIEVPLPSGLVTLVDDVDAWVLNHRWHVTGLGYVGRSIKVRGRGTTVRMHREITQALPGFEVDHINGNRLDNRRANLRLCTRDENARNRLRYRNNPVGLKGVSRQGNRWRAMIQVDGRKLHLGMFDTSEEAFAAYRMGSKKHHGAFGSDGLNDREVDVQQ